MNPQSDGCYWNKSYPPMNSQADRLDRDEPSTALNPQTYELDRILSLLEPSLAKNVCKENSNSDLGKKTMMNEISNSVDVKLVKINENSKYFDVKKFTMKIHSNSEDVKRIYINATSTIKETDKVLHINSRDQIDSKKYPSRKLPLLKCSCLSTKSHCDFSIDMKRFSPDIGRPPLRRVASVSACSPGHASSRNGKRLAERLVTKLKLIEPKMPRAKAMRYLRHWVVTKFCPELSASVNQVGYNLRDGRQRTCGAAEIRSKKWCLVNHRVVSRREVNEAFTGTDKIGMLGKQIKMYELIVRYMDIVSTIFEMRICDDKQVLKNSVRDLKKSYLTYSEAVSDHLYVDVNQVMSESNKNDLEARRMSPGLKQTDQFIGMKSKIGSRSVSQGPNDLLLDGSVRTDSFKRESVIEDRERRVHRHKDKMLCSPDNGHNCKDKMLGSLEHEHNCKDKKGKPPRKKWENDGKWHDEDDLKLDVKEITPSSKVQSERKESNNSARIHARSEVHQFSNDIKRNPIYSSTLQLREHRLVEAGRDKGGRDSPKRRRYSFASRKFNKKQQGFSRGRKYLLEANRFNSPHYGRGKSPKRGETWGSESRSQPREEVFIRRYSSSEDTAGKGKKPSHHTKDEQFSGRGHNSKDRDDVRRRESSREGRKKREELHPFDDHQKNVKKSKSYLVIQRSKTEVKNADIDNNIRKDKIFVGTSSKILNVDCFKKKIDIKSPSLKTSDLTCKEELQNNHDLTKFRSECKLSADSSDPKFNKFEVDPSPDVTPKSSKKYRNKRFSVAVRSKCRESSPGLVNVDSIRHVEQTPKSKSQRRLKNKGFMRGKPLIQTKQAGKPLIQTKQGLICVECRGSELSIKSQKLTWSPNVHTEQVSPRTVLFKTGDVDTETGQGSCVKKADTRTRSLGDNNSYVATVIVNRCHGGSFKRCHSEISQPNDVQSCDTTASQQVPGITAIKGSKPTELIHGTEERIIQSSSKKQLDHEPVATKRHLTDVKSMTNKTDVTSKTKKRDVTSTSNKTNLTRKAKKHIKDEFLISTHAPKSIISLNSDQSWKIGSKHHNNSHQHANDECHGKQIMSGNSHYSTDNQRSPDHKSLQSRWNKCQLATLSRDCRGTDYMIQPVKTKPHLVLRCGLNLVSGGVVNGVNSEVVGDHSNHSTLTNRPPINVVSVSAPLTDQCPDTPETEVLADGLFENCAAVNEVSIDKLLLMDNLVRMDNMVPMGNMMPYTTELNECFVKSLVEVRRLDTATRPGIAQLVDSTKGALNDYIHPALSCGYPVPSRIEFENHFPELTIIHPSLQSPVTNSIYKRVPLEVLEKCHSNDPRKSFLPPAKPLAPPSLTCNVIGQSAGENVSTPDKYPVIPQGTHDEKTNAKMFSLPSVRPPRNFPKVNDITEIMCLPKNEISYESFILSKLDFTGNIQHRYDMNKKNVMPFNQKSTRKVQKLPRLYDPIICPQLSKQQTIGILDEFCNTERPISPLPYDDCDEFREPVSFPMFCSGPERLYTSSFPHSGDVILSCPLTSVTKNLCSCSVSVPCASARRYGVCEITIVQLVGTLFGQTFLSTQTSNKSLVSMNKSAIRADVCLTPTNPSSKIGFGFNSRSDFQDGVSKIMERTQPSSLKSLCISNLVKLTRLTQQHCDAKTRRIYSESIQDEREMRDHYTSLKRKVNMAEFDSEDERGRQQKLAKMDHCGHKNTLLVSAEFNTNNCHNSGSELADDESSTQHSPPSLRMDNSGNTSESENFLCDVMSTPIVLSASDRVYHVTRTERDPADTILNLNSHTMVKAGFRDDRDGDENLEESSSASGSSQDLLERAMDIAGISEKTIDSFLKSDFSIHYFLLNDVYIPPDEEEYQCVYEAEIKPSSSNMQKADFHELDHHGPSNHVLNWDLSAQTLPSGHSESTDVATTEGILDSLFKPIYNMQDTTIYAPFTSYQYNDMSFPKITLSTEPKGCNLKSEPTVFCLGNSGVIELTKQDEILDSWSNEIFQGNEWDGISLDMACGQVNITETIETGSLNPPKENTQDQVDLDRENKSLEIWSEEGCTMVLTMSRESRGSENQQIYRITEDPYQITEALELLSSPEKSNTRMMTKREEKHGADVELFSHSFQSLRRSKRKCQKQTHRNGSREYGHNSGGDMLLTGSRRRDLLRACSDRQVAPHTRASIRRKNFMTYNATQKRKKSKKRNTAIPFKARSLVCIDQTRRGHCKIKKRKKQSVKIGTSSSAKISYDTTASASSSTQSKTREDNLKTNFTISPCSVQLVPLEIQVEKSDRYISGRGYLNTSHTSEQQSSGADQRTHSEVKKPLSVYFENRKASVSRFTKQLTQSCPGLLQHVRSVEPWTSHQKIDKISTKILCPLRLAKRTRKKLGPKHNSSREGPTQVVSDGLNYNNNAGKDENNDDSLNTNQGKSGKKGGHQLLHRSHQSQVRLPRVYDQNLSLERSRKKLAQLQSKILKRHKDLHEAPKSVSFGSGLSFDLNMAHGRDLSLGICAGDRTHSEMASDDNRSVNNVCQLPAVTRAKCDRIKVVNFVKRIDSRYGDQLTKGDNNTKLRLNKFCKDYLTLHGVRSRQDHIVKKPSPFESRNGEASTSRFLANHESKSLVNMNNSKSQGLMSDQLCSNSLPCSSSQPCSISQLEQPGIAKRFKSVSEVKVSNHPIETNSMTQVSVDAVSQGCQAVKKPSPNLQDRKIKKKNMKALRPDILSSVNRLTAKPPSPTARLVYQIQGLEREFGKSLGAQDAFGTGKFKNKLSRFWSTKPTVGSYSEHFFRGVVGTAAVSEEKTRHRGINEPSKSQTREGDKKESKNKRGDNSLKREREEFSDDDDDTEIVTRDERGAPEPPILSHRTNDDGIVSPLKTPIPPLDIKCRGDISPRKDTLHCDMSFCRNDQSNCSDIKAIEIEPLAHIKRNVDISAFSLDFVDLFNQSVEDMFHESDDNQSREYDFDQKSNFSENLSDKSRSDTKGKHSNTETLAICHSYQIVDPTVTRYFRNRIPSGGKKVKSLVVEGSDLSVNVNKDRTSTSLVDDLQPRDLTPSQLITSNATDDVNESCDNVMKTPVSNSHAVNVISAKVPGFEPEPIIYPCALPLGMTEDFLRANYQDRTRPIESPDSQDFDILCYDLPEIKNCPSPGISTHLLDSSSESCLIMSEQEAEIKGLCDALDHETNPPPETGHLNLEDWLIHEEDTRPESRSSGSSVKSPDSCHDGSCDIYRVESLTSLKKAIDRDFNISFEDIPSLISLADEKDSNHNTSGSSEGTEQDIIWTQIDTAGSRTFKPLTPILEDDEEYEMFQNEA